MTAVINNDTEFIELFLGGNVTFEQNDYKLVLDENSNPIVNMLL
jgi:hypothetical protein